MSLETIHVRVLRVQFNASCWFGGSYSSFQPLVVCLTRITRVFECVYDLRSDDINGRLIEKKQKQI